MANGTLINLAPGQGKTDLLRAIVNVLGGTGSSYDGESELIAAIATLLQNLNAPQSLQTGPATAVSETIPRAVAGESVTIATVSGTIYMMACYIPINTVVNNITTVVGSTASSNDVTINWAALCDNTRKVLAISANATAQLTPAGFNNTLALSAAFTTTYSGLYYVAYTVGATTTQPTMTGVTSAGTELNKIVPILCGTSSTSGTATPPAVGTTLGAITATVNNIYAFLT